MKIGLVSAILGDYTYKDMIDIVSRMGFRCVEVACWPQGKAERRYAGVSHIDVDNTSADYIKCWPRYCVKHLFVKRNFYYSFSFGYKNINSNPHRFMIFSNSRKNSPPHSCQHR